MARKIIVFPNDSLKSYFEKGEIAEKYFNPDNFFQEVHVISLNDKEIEEDKVKILAGNSCFKIHKVGRPRASDFIKGTLQKKINSIICEIRPQILRAYNSTLGGWLAVRTGQNLNIPAVISLHSHPEKDIRAHINNLKEPKRRLFWSFSKVFFEPYALLKADRVICVYEFLRDYASKFGTPDERIKIIYNRIDMDRFTNNEHCSDRDMTPIRILCVGRIFKDKNPENIIRAIKDMEVKLTLIGDGEYSSRLMKLVSDLNIKDKVNFIPSVPYSEIHHFYRDADIFASCNIYGGVSKPVIEAMASGLPIIINKPLWEDKPELVGETALVVENSPSGYKHAFEKLIADSSLRKKLSFEARLKALQVNGKRMEEEEKRLYQFLIKSKG